MIEVVQLVLLLSACLLTDGNLVLTSNPVELIPGFTRRISINCSYVPYGDTPLEHPSMLHVSKNNGSSLETLASVDPQHGVKAEQFRHGQLVKASGRIEANGISVLTVEWDNPTPDDSGLYQCSIIGTDKDELPHEEISRMNVLEKKPSSEDLMYRIFELENDLKRCAEYIKGWENECNESAIEQLETAQYFPPAYYGSSKYFLSRRNFTSDLDSSRQCEILGGYLAEVGSREEQMEILALLRKHVVDGALIAGSDSATESSWVYQRTGKLVAYLHWSPGEPNNQNTENCLSLYLRENGEMNDIPCANNNLIFPYVCEIPGSCRIL